MLKPEGIGGIWETPGGPPAPNWETPGYPGGDCTGPKSARIVISITIPALLGPRKSLQNNIRHNLQDDLQDDPKQEPSARINCREAVTACHNRDSLAIPA